MDRYLSPSDIAKLLREAEEIGELPPEDDSSSVVNLSPGETYRDVVITHANGKTYVADQIVSDGSMVFIGLLGTTTKSVDTRRLRKHHPHISSWYRVSESVPTVYLENYRRDARWLDIGDLSEHFGTPLSGTGLWSGKSLTDAFKVSKNYIHEVREHLKKYVRDRRRQALTKRRSATRLTDSDLAFTYTEETDVPSLIRANVELCKELSDHIDQVAEGNKEYSPFEGLGSYIADSVSTQISDEFDNIMPEESSVNYWAWHKAMEQVHTRKIGVKWDPLLNEYRPLNAEITAGIVRASFRFDYILSRLEKRCLVDLAAIYLSAHKTNTSTNSPSLQRSKEEGQDRRGGITPDSIRSAVFGTLRDTKYLSAVFSLAHIATVTGPTKLITMNLANITDIRYQ